MQYDLIIFVLIFIGADSSLSYFLTRSGHCSKEFTSTRGRVPLRLFSFYWYRGTANTNPSVPSNKRSNGQWPSCEGEVLRHLYAVSSSPLLALLHLQQLCWTFWSPLPLGGPMYWTGMIIDIDHVIDFMLPVSSIMMFLVHYRLAFLLFKYLFLVFPMCRGTTVTSFCLFLRQLFYVSMCFPSQHFTSSFWWMIIMGQFGRQWKSPLHLLY